VAATLATERVANLYRAHITLASGGADGLRVALQTTAAGQVQGRTGKFFNKYVVILLGHKLLGEASNQPPVAAAPGLQPNRDPRPLRL